MRTKGKHGEAARGARADAGMAAERPPCGGTLDATPDPRTVTTGGKINKEEPVEPLKVGAGTDAETGEPRAVVWSPSGHLAIVRMPEPDASVSPGIAQIDALAFTVIPPDDESMLWLLAEMRQFLPIDRLKDGRGCFGFKQSARFGEGVGLIAWGGASQRDRVYFSIQGKGCALVTDWAGLAEWLESYRAKLKRTDVAHDDIYGRVVSIRWAIEQYHAGGFNAGGRMPQHQMFGDCLLGDASIKGRTLGIGSRTSGKYCRIYEKGKQLGDPSSPWARVEVEWRGKDRLIPYDILTRPGAYLAGAYPCLASLNIEQSRIKTVANAATIAFDTAVANGKQQVGKLVNLMRQVYGGDLGEVVNKLWRDGIPGRIEPHSYHLAEAPELLDPDTPGSFAEILKSK